MSNFVRHRKGIIDTRLRRVPSIKVSIDMLNKTLIYLLGIKQLPARRTDIVGKFE